MNNNTGLLVAISSPSGGGKSTVIQRLIKDNSLPFVYSISTTTRPKRNGEKDGVHYRFVSELEFKSLIQKKEFIEYETVHDNLYGTPKTPIIHWIKEGKIVLLDLDVYGALNLKREFPDNSLLIFLKPPDLDTLNERLSGRLTETQKQIDKRLQRVPQELNQEKFFDVTVVNNELEDTVLNVKRLIINRSIKEEN